MTEFELFDAARKITDPVARAAFLDQACAGNAALRASVESLLNAPATNLAAFDAPSAVAPTVIGAALPVVGTLLAGRYKLLENIGVGGMGTVWVAEQQAPVKRKVAVKLIKAGMDSRQVLARFEAERQALALMDHPNIAKVFDGGVTDQGHPFFVMEYVKGVPLTDYCDRARLSVKERLKLFIPVCQAVQHAHHKGIVHRDLKPSNILVCLYDGHPVPKVIDFGLAKALHQPLTEQTLHTAHGLMLGTPLYMSPEQAEVNNLDVDTRTDIYSLGVVLYELLTGTTPLEKQQFQQAAYDEILRLIKDVEPPKPSTRLSSTDKLPSIAAQRNIDPRQLAKSLTGDLDWIVMKSLEKERSRRYETANGFARDIERFLNEEAVEACPPSTAYRIRKFVKRYRGQVIAASVVLMTLLLGIIGTSVGLRWAWIAQQQTDKALETVKTERDEKGGALNEKSAALTAKSQALVAKETALQAEAKARNEETRQRDRAERNLALSLLSPIGYDPEQVNEAECRSFAAWSALDSRLKWRVLDTAFQDPDMAMRLARRSEQVVQACVGLSPVRRQEMADYLTRKLNAEGGDVRIRIASLWTGLPLGVWSESAFKNAADYLLPLEKHQVQDASLFWIEVVKVRTAEEPLLEQYASRYCQLVKQELNSWRLHEQHSRSVPKAIVSTAHWLNSVSAQELCESLLRTCNWGKDADCAASMETVEYLLSTLPSKARSDVVEYAVGFTRHGRLDPTFERRHFIDFVAGHSFDLAPARRLPCLRMMFKYHANILASNDHVFQFERVVSSLLSSLNDSELSLAHRDLLVWVNQVESLHLLERLLTQVYCRRMDSVQAIETWNAVNTRASLDAAASTFFMNHWSSAIELPESVAQRLPDDFVQNTYQHCISVIEEASFTWDYFVAVQSAVALRSRLDISQKQRLSDLLHRIIVDSVRDFNQRTAINGLASLIPHLPVSQAAELTDTLFRLSTEAPDASVRGVALQRVLDLFPYSSQPVQRQLVSRMLKSLGSDSDAARDLAAMPSVVSRLDDVDFGKLVEHCISAYSVGIHDGDGVGLGFTVRSSRLPACYARLSVLQKQQLFRVIEESCKEQDYRDDLLYSDVLAVVKPAIAPQAWARFVHAMLNSPWNYAVWQLPW